MSSAVIRLVSPHELEALMAAAEIDVVDVREAHERETGHVPGSRHVPLGTLRTDPRAHLPRDGVVFVCAKGGRSASAAELAIGLGLGDVASLDGGTLAWVAARLPLEGLPRGSAAPPLPSPATDLGEVPPAEPELDAILSANLRRERARAGMSLDELAGRSGVSRTQLGQYELGRTVPAIATTWRIAQALGVPFSALLATDTPTGLRVLRRADARVLTSADGRFTSRALFPLGEPHSAEFYELTLAPHSYEEADAHRRGTTENLVVTSGRLQLDVGGRSVAMGPGDAVLFRADVPHRYANPGSEPCVMYLVITYDAN
jgi:rhodanese-related sulfurtransferase/transcriptional regulator with XRE-family HTH domain